MEGARRPRKETNFSKGHRLRWQAKDFSEGRQASVEDDTGFDERQASFPMRGQLF